MLQPAAQVHLDHTLSGLLKAVRTCKFDSTRLLAVKLTAAFNESGTIDISSKAKRSWIQHSTGDACVDHKVQPALYCTVRTLHTFSMAISWALIPAVSRDSIMQVSYSSIRLVVYFT